MWCILVQKRKYVSWYAVYKKLFKTENYFYLIKFSNAWLHNHNIYPVEEWEVCDMFVTAAFKVKLQFTKSILSVSTICIDACLTTGEKVGKIASHGSTFFFCCARKSITCARCGWSFSCLNVMPYWVWFFEWIK